MRLASKTRYGLRVLQQVAVESARGRRANGKAIAEKQAISEPTLEQVLATLRKGGFVHATRGRNGGYTLARHAEQITLLDIIELFEGPIQLNPTQNDHEDQFTTHSTARAWQALNDSFCREARAVTLAAVLRDDRDTMPEFVI